MVDQIFAHRVCFGSPLVVRLVQLVVVRGVVPARGVLRGAEDLSQGTEPVGDGGDVVMKSSAPVMKGDDGKGGKWFRVTRAFSFWGSSAW